MLIHPGHTGPGVTIEALRLYCERVNAPTKVAYLDITQSTLIRALLPFLENLATVGKVLSFRRAGRGVRSVFTIQVGEL